MAQPTQFLSLPGGNIAYDIQGKGPLVICLPAGGDTRLSYKYLTPQLIASGHTVVTMDLRGQGESTAFWPSYKVSNMSEDVVALISHLKQGSAILIGNSVSAGIAAWTAGAHPELISKIILTGPFARTSPVVKSWLMSNISLAPLWGIKLYTPYFTSMHPGTKHEGFVAQRNAALKMLHEKGKLAAVRSMFSQANKGLDEQLATIKQPVMILMGSKDPDFPKPEKEVEELVTRLTSTKPEMHMIEGVGHHPHAQAPEEVGKLIVTFIK